jgi:hypothetical protein
MIRPPFVTIEGQLLSVRTVIYMLHYIPYENWCFPNWLKSHLSLAPPFINTMYVMTWPISKGGTSERCYRTRHGRTDEQRYAILSPYFDGRIKMNGPYPEITNISFWRNYFSKLSSVWLRRGCLFAWRTDGHNSGVFRWWMEICEWKHEYKVHRLESVLFIYVFFLVLV